MEYARVLSIQSHVVRGYVGNKSATFPLQLLGFEVDAINSVQFSNHTGYKHVKGQILNESDLGVLTEALAANDLYNYSHLLTGYVGTPSFLKKIADVVKELRQKNPNLLYVCDPVMGDNGQMYVPDSLLPIYKDTIVPLADIITPNQYELELLTGKSVNSLDAAWEAMNDFHKKGCKHVVISSSTLGNKNELMALASSVKEAHVTDGERTKAEISFPQLDANFTGTGDLFTALFLAWMYKTDNNITLSLDNTIASLQAVLSKTLSHALYLSDGANPTVDQKELRLIQSKQDIENPQPSYFSRIVE